MPQTFLTEKKTILTPPRSVIAGAVASFLTQPFEVLKTNMINSPSVYIRDLHSTIIKKGWNQYMRGSTLAVIRQGYGFTIYTSIISYLNKELETLGTFNKYYKYSISAFVGKLTAMVFEAPLTLLKTRMELVSDSTIKKQILQILKNPRQEMLKGLKATVIRESVFSLIHYNTYRFLKDDIYKVTLGIDSVFYPAFLAGALAITLSHPFEVIRNKVSIYNDLGFFNCIRSTWAQQGWRGFFVGYMPRLLRKPINSGICWTILESVKQ